MQAVTKLFALSRHANAILALLARQRKKRVLTVKEVYARIAQIAHSAALL
jgi:hypothetical protein